MSRKLKCNRIVISDHAKGRLLIRAPGMSLKRAQHEIQHKIASALRKGIKPDWDGAIQVKFWQCPGLWAVCYALLLGGWGVATIFREGWIDDMEEQEGYTFNKMTDDEYIQIQHQLTMMAQLINEIDLAGFMLRIAEADSVGAMLDPTLYRAAMPGLGKVKKLATAARQFQAAVHEVLREEAKGR